MTTPFAPRRALVCMLSTVALAGASLLAGCASTPRTVGFSEAQLVERMARQFPVRTRVLGIFDVEVTNPRVQLRPDSNRIATRLDYALGSALAGSRRTLGQMQLSYALRYEPTDQTVRLSDVRAEAVDAGAEAAPEAGGANPGAPRLQQLAGLLAQSLLKDHVIYRFKPEDLRAAEGRGVQPGPIRVVPGGVQMELVPVAR